MEKILELVNQEVLVPVLISCIALDIISGVLQALKNGTFEAKIMAKGLEKQIYIAFPIAVAFMFDKLIVSSNGWFLNMACIFYICYELSSLFENLGKVIPIPKFLIDMFKVLQDVDKNIIPKPSENIK